MGEVTSIGTMRRGRLVGRSGVVGGVVGAFCLTGVIMVAGS